MHLKKHLTVFCLMCLTALSAYSQGLEYVTGEYDMLEPISDNLMRYRLENKVGILKADGSLVQEWTADYITAFHDGMALVLAKRDGHYRIHRLIDIDLSVREPQKEMFVDAYPFFSEGYLPVYCKLNKKKYCFVDRYCSPVTNEQFEEIKPCLKGKALVNVIKKNDGKWTEIDLSNVNGINALLGFSKRTVSEEEGGYYSSCEDKKDILTYMDSYHYPVNPDGPTAFKDSKGLYGYMENGVEIIPAQFKFATNFHDGKSIVTFENGKSRIAKLLSCTTKLSSSYLRNPDGTYSFSFYVVTPSETQKDINEHPVALKVRCISPTGDVVYAQKKGLNYFELDRESLKGTAEVCLNDFILSRIDLEKSSIELITLELAASKTSVRANVNNSASVQLTVTNPGSRAVDFNISSSGKSAVFSQSSMTVPAGESVKITASFYNITASTWSTITINGDDIPSASVKIQLRTYF